MFRWLRALLRLGEPPRSESFQPHFEPLEDRLLLSGTPSVIGTVEMPLDGNVSAAVYDSSGAFVRTLMEAEQHSAGSVDLVWDGTDNFGAVLPDGNYQFRAIVSQAQAVDDGHVGDGDDLGYGLNEHNNAVAAVAVDAAGNVYESSAYEETNHELRKWDANGNPVWTAGFIGGSGGLAVDDTYVYAAKAWTTSWSPGPNNRVERLWASDGTPAPWSGLPEGYIITNTTLPEFTIDVHGLTVDATRLWISNHEQDRVEVYDKATGLFLSQFAVTDPEGIASDGQGNAWVAHSGSHVTRFTASGTALNDIAGLNQPYAVAVGGPAGSLFVGEIGTGKVREFDATTLDQTRELFGAAQPGPVSDNLFYWTTTGRAGLAVDALGRMIVADDGNHRVLTYDASGTLLRTRYSQFTFAPFTDPSIDPGMLLDGNMQYQVDYTPGPTYGEWQVTHNWRPADDQLWSMSAIRRRLSNGKDYLYYVQLPGSTSQNKIDVVIYALEPSGMRRSAMIGSDPNGLWIWTDANGDGVVEGSEKSYVTGATIADYITTGPGIWVDNDGNIWFPRWREPVEGTSLGVQELSNTVKLALEGFDAEGNPLYDWSHRETVVPADSTMWQFLPNNMRVDSTTGELFLLGRTSRNRDEELLWGGGTTVERLTADGSRIMIIPISDQLAQVVHPTPGSNQHVNALALDTDGNYFYTGHSGPGFTDPPWVRMYTTDGLLVTTGLVGANHGGQSGWIDHGLGISAFTHPNGTHYLYAEDSFYGKGIRYRIDDLETLTRSQGVFAWDADGGPLVVTTTNDYGAGSLRSAIWAANANPGHDVIHFDIPGAGPHTIDLTWHLPAITEGVTIDATTQPGFAGAPLIEINGTANDRGFATRGLAILGDNSILRGLVVNRFGFEGVIIEGNNNVLEGNYIGTDLSGTAIAANGRPGVVITGASNRVGSDGDGVNDALERNVIAGNPGQVLIHGSTATHNIIAGNYLGTDATGTTGQRNHLASVEISDGAAWNIIGTSGGTNVNAAQRNIISGSHFGVRIAGLGTDHNVVAGNYIGTNAAGTEGPNTFNETGVWILDGAKSNVIGSNGDGAGDEDEKNVISGNLLSGVLIQGAGTQFNLVAGNYIGLDATGAAALGNGLEGVAIEAGATDNQVGGSAPGQRNVISGNAPGRLGYGVRLSSDANVVVGNYIGTDATGTIAIGNSPLYQEGAGVAILSAKSNRIGTDGDNVADALERNVISGHTGAGVLIQGAGAEGNVVAGNFVGTDATGTVALGNLHAVQLLAGSRGTRVGTNGDGVADEAERNVISGNRGFGVDIRQSSDNIVAGNYLGVDVTGAVALGNDMGVSIGGLMNRVGTDGNGLADAAERNVISGNGVGVLIGSEQNVVAGNYIGTDATGSVALGNRGPGVLIGSGANRNRVGTAGDGEFDATERNVISGNSNGVEIGSNYNVVAGNFIGTDATGLVALGNRANGVVIGGGDNRVGTNGDGVGDADERNVISGNQGFGAYIVGAGSHHNVVAGNYLGTDATGLVALGNAAAGVGIEWGAQHNRIGTDGDGAGDAAEGNLISGNGLYGGVFIAQAGTDHNQVFGNRIGTAASGETALGNTGGGVWVLQGAAFNEIGGSGVAGNTIAFNTGPGVAVTEGSVGNRIQGNAIHSNSSLGIDLGKDGSNSNDAGDADLGPNTSQNFPVILSARGGSSTRVSGTLNSVAERTFTLDFYASATPDPSGFGEGQRHLGSATVTTDTSGNADYDVLLSSASSLGEVITATATEEPSGNTSEFSAGITVDSVALDLAADNASVTVDEGQQASNTGTFGDRGGDTVTLSASVGTVVDNGDGTWSWFFDTSDGPGQSQLVTITATDSDLAQSSATFQLTVNNVAPIPQIVSISEPRKALTAIFVTGSASDAAGEDDTLTYGWAVFKEDPDTPFAASSGVDFTTFSFTPDGPGSYRIVLTVSDEDGGSATVEQPIVVEKADATVDVTGGTFTYDAATHAATAAAVGVKGEALGPVEITYNDSPNLPTNAGTYNVLAFFAGNDIYNSAANTATVEILKADPIVAVLGGTFAYDGEAHPADFAAMGVEGESLGPLTVTYNGSTSPPVVVGTYEVEVSYAGDGNYNSAIRLTTLVISSSDQDTRGVGYWKNHASDWNVDSLTLGGFTYSKDELLTILSTSVSGDARVILAKQLIAAKLNLLHGSDSVANVQSTIDQADELFADLGIKIVIDSGQVRVSSTLGKKMVDFAKILEAFNNGDLS